MTNEHEMRVTRNGAAAGEGELRDALRQVDPTAIVRLAPETGIVHVQSVRDTLDLVDALGKAGFEAGAATG